MEWGPSGDLSQRLWVPCTSPPTSTGEGHNSAAASCASGGWTGGVTERQPEKHILWAARKHKSHTEINWSFELLFWRGKWFVAANKHTTQQQERWYKNIYVLCLGCRGFYPSSEILKPLLKRTTICLSPWLTGGCWNFKSHRGTCSVVEEQIEYLGGGMACSHGQTGR